jgi:uncharacterized lipoprotein YehR (DUF1307 family)
MSCKHRKCAISEEIKPSYKETPNVLGVKYCCEEYDSYAKNGVTIKLSQDTIEQLQNMNPNATVAEIIEEILKGKHD